MGISFGLDPVLNAVHEALATLERGDHVAERRHLDLKEEVGRRDPVGNLVDGDPRDERTAKQLTHEAACMANTPGGGALIVGASDESRLIGAASDADWLQHRIFQLTDRRLTVVVNEAHLRGVRLLVIRSPQAVEPVRYRNRIYWRLDEHCVEIDPSTWHERRAYVTQYDWSAQPSHLDESAVRAGSIERAREFLLESDEPQNLDLAQVPAADLLRRLNAVTGEGLLTNAGALAFVGRDVASLDYIRREVAGGDSLERVRRPGRGALEELAEVFLSFNAYNPTTHQEGGLARGQIRAIPTRAAREAIVNAVVHRDWTTQDPSTVEHTGHTLIVTSPGGFFGGVNSRNVISHPSRSRNTAFTELLASLRVAEREGVGVDRMFRDSLLQGNRVPELVELDTPAVQVTLSGEQRDPAWSEWIREVEPAHARSDLRWLMSLHRLVTSGWIDIASLAPFLQATSDLTSDVVAALWKASVDNGPLIDRVSGTPTGAADAWVLTTTASERLRELDEVGAFRRVWPSAGILALSYARHRGRISSTELGSLTGKSATNVGTVLRALEEEGHLEPSRSNRRGAGFYYRYVPAD